MCARDWMFVKVKVKVKVKAHALHNLQPSANMQEAPKGVQRTHLVWWQSHMVEIPFRSSLPGQSKSYFWEMKPACLQSPDHINQKHCTLPTEYRLCNSTIPKNILIRTKELLWNDLDPNLWIPKIHTCSVMECNLKPENLDREMSNSLTNTHTHCTPSNTYKRITMKWKTWAWAPSFTSTILLIGNKTTYHFCKLSLKSFTWREGKVFDESSWKENFWSWSPAIFDAVSVVSFPVCEWM